MTMWSIDAKVIGRAKWCSDNLCMNHRDIPKLQMCDTNLTSSIRWEWTSGNELASWAKVMEYEWHMINSTMMHMKGGQVLSMDGLLGTCHDLAPIEHVKHQLMLRMCSNCGNDKQQVVVENIVQHHTGEVLKHCNRNGDVVLILPSDLDFVLDWCPSVVVNDLYRLWSMVDETLPGVSLTTLTFPNGTVDYEPWKVGLKFLLLQMPRVLHSYIKDPMYRLYSSFIYLPKQFRMSTLRVQQGELSTDKFCHSYVSSMDFQLNSFGMRTKECI